MPAAGASKTARAVCPHGVPPHAAAPWAVRLREHGMSA